MTKITLLCFVKVGCIECSSLLCFFVLIVYACFNICSELSSFTEAIMGLAYPMLKNS